MADKEKNQQDGEEDLENGIVTLLDDEGNEHNFEHLDTFEFNGETYVVLLPAEEDEEESDEVLIFALGKDEDGKEVLLPIEDEAELDMAFEEFKTRMADEFDFE